MNRQDIIAMADTAASSIKETFSIPAGFLEKFAALVVAKDRQRLASDVELPEPEGWRVTDGEGGFDCWNDEPSQMSIDHAAMYDRQFQQIFTADQLRDYGDRRAAAERETRAKMVDHILREGGGTWGDAIRTRSHP